MLRFPSTFMICCAVLAFSAIKNNDKVGLFIFSDKTELFIPPRKGRRPILRIVREMLAFAAERTRFEWEGDRLWEIAERNTPHERVADYTQAIMDLGATLCTRSNPACDRCPVAADCEALSLGSVTELPGRKPKKEKPLRATTMVLACHDGQVYLERRPESGIWGGLWSLPEVNGTSVEDWCRERLAGKPGQIESWQVLRHSFSHYDLDIQPIVVRIEAPLSKVADFADAGWHPLDNELPGGVAAPVSKLIEQLKNGTNR